MSTTSPSPATKASSACGSTRAMRRRASSTRSSAAGLTAPPPRPGTEPWARPRARRRSSGSTSSTSTGERRRGRSAPGRHRCSRRRGCDGPRTRWRRRHGSWPCSNTGRPSPPTTTLVSVNSPATTTTAPDDPPWSWSSMAPPGGEAMTQASTALDAQHRGPTDGTRDRTSPATPPPPPPATGRSPPVPPRRRDGTLRPTWRRRVRAPPRPHARVGPPGPRVGWRAAGGRRRRAGARVPET